MASISAALESMLHLTTSNPHHEFGPTRVARDAEIVLKVIAAIDTNPFSATMTALVNISTGQLADPVVQEHLRGVNQLGLKALSCSIHSFIFHSSFIHNHFKSHQITLKPS